MTYVPLQISCRLSFSFSFFSNNLFSDFTKTSSCDFRYNMTRTIIKVPQEPLKLMDMPGNLFIFSYGHVDKFSANSIIGILIFP